MHTNAKRLDHGVVHRPDGKRRAGEGDGHDDALQQAGNDHR